MSGWVALWCVPLCADFSCPSPTTQLCIHSQTVAKTIPHLVRGALVSTLKYNSMPMTAVKLAFRGVCSALLPRSWAKSETRRRTCSTSHASSHRSSLALALTASPPTPVTPHNAHKHRSRQSAGEKSRPSKQQRGRHVFPSPSSPRRVSLSTQRGTSTITPNACRVLYPSTLLPRVYIALALPSPTPSYPNHTP